MKLVKLSGPLIKTRLLVPLSGDCVIGFLGKFDPFLVCMERLNHIPEDKDYARLEEVDCPPSREPDWSDLDNAVPLWRKWRLHAWTKKFLVSTADSERTTATFVMKALSDNA